jgi:hypothetical protein
MSITLRSSTFALAILGSATLLSAPSFAVEPDVDSPAGPELPAPRTDRPDFQADDQTGAELNTVPGPAEPGVIEGPTVMIPDDDASEAPKGKTEDSDPSD